MSHTTHRRRPEQSRQKGRELHAIERAFLSALERGDRASDQLVRKLLAVVQGEDRPDRRRAC